MTRSWNPILDRRGCGFSRTVLDLLWFLQAYCGFADSAVFVAIGPMRFLENGCRDARTKSVYCSMYESFPDSITEALGNVNCGVLDAHRDLAMRPRLTDGGAAQRFKEFPFPLGQDGAVTCAHGLEPLIGHGLVFAFAHRPGSLLQQSLRAPGSAVAVGGDDELEVRNKGLQHTACLQFS